MLFSPQNEMLFLFEFGPGNEEAEVEEVYAEQYPSVRSELVPILCCARRFVYKGNKENIVISER